MEDSGAMIQIVKAMLDRFRGEDDLQQAWVVVVIVGNGHKKESTTIDQRKREERLV
jgi:hypothetical protein